MTSPATFMKWLEGRQRPVRRLLEITLATLVLALLVRYSLGRFEQAPFAGFRHSNAGEVVDIFTPEAGDLQIGDRLRRVGAVSWESYDSDPELHLFAEAAPEQPLPIVVERGGRPVTVEWVFPGPNPAERIQRFNSEWWLPYVFWLAGIATLFFVRPRDTRWRLLIAFNFFTAIWLAAGGVTLWRIGASKLVFRIALWLCVPVYLHLHWLFPRPLGRRLPAWFWGLLYTAAGGLALLELAGRLPDEAYTTAFFLAAGGSVLLLFARLIFARAQRRSTLLLLAAPLVALLPIASLGLAAGLGFSLPVFVKGGVLLALPAMPGAYFYTIYRQQLGARQERARRVLWLYLLSVALGTVLLLGLALADTRSPGPPSSLWAGSILFLVTAFMSIMAIAPFSLLVSLSDIPLAGEQNLLLRANRQMTGYLFFTLLALLLTVVLTALSTWRQWPPAGGIFAGIIASFLLVGSFEERLQRFFDRRLLGISLPPSRLLERYAAEITTSLERQRLVRLLSGEVLPSLLVRQSALFHFGEVEPEVILAHGVAAEQVPIPEGAGAADAGGEGGLPAWVRLVLPLTIDGETVGVWWFGRRDPDDWYSPSELPTFRALAHQTAVALSNIVQAETLHTLYQMNIERREEERNRLARDLHDGVLGELGTIILYLDAETLPPQFYQAYERLIARLRQTIGGLRPAMLNYGVRAGLEELVDDLNERARDPVSLRLAVPASEARYPVQVEQHLFRIVQQATENALRHAQAERIDIRGRLEADAVELTVVDDGVGIDARALDLATLLTHDHFGLASIKERAALIGADLKILSAPGRGTTVRVRWQPEVAGGSGAKTGEKR